MSGAWYGRDMPEMWASAQAADTRMAWDQVLAWRRTHDLLDFHQSQLRRAREELLAAWPPERSPAAAAFADHIDRTIQTLDEAKVCAAKNQDALAAVLSSLRDTRNDMAVLVQEWEEHQKTPVSAGRSAVIPPSYTVTVRAQERMARNDQEVLAAYRTMTELPKSSDEAWVGDQRWRQPEPPGHPPSGGAVGPGSRGGHLPLSPTTIQSPAMVDAAAGLTGPVGAGLAGSVTADASPRADGLPAQSGIGSPASAAPGILPRPVGGFPGPGGVAGTHPGMNSGTALPGGRVGGVRVNPVGGVIGGPDEAVPAHGAQQRGPSTEGPGGRGAGSGIGTAMPMSGAGGGRRADERGQEPARRLQWDVPQGVPPVIEAPPDIPFELGPGVFGIDRA